MAYNNSSNLQNTPGGNNSPTTLPSAKYATNQTSYNPTMYVSRPNPNNPVGYPVAEDGRVPVMIFNNPPTTMATGVPPPPQEPPACCNSEVFFAILGALLAVFYYSNLIESRLLNECSVSPHYGFQLGN